MNSIKSKIGHNLTDKGLRSPYSPRSNASSPSPDLDMSGEISVTPMVSVHSKDSSTRPVSVKHGGECIEGCTLKHSKNMIRCMHCMLWCHLKCVGEPNDYSWVCKCLTCRQFPRLLNALVLMSNLTAHASSESNCQILAMGLLVLKIFQQL